jgi:ABC-2 type transport system ATP-binding protein
MHILQADQIVKRYSHHLALDRVSVTVPRGSIFGLLGPNGAGKTTLIRIINQITGPDEGQVFFDGEPLKPSHVGQIGYLPEERGLYKKMKAGEQALYLAQLKGISHKLAMERLKYWFKKFEIESWWNRKVEELSKGMQQKIQFIVTILHEPRLLIFDEPFSGFDPINTDMLKNEILRLKATGSTIIFSTHNMASVEELCDNIALIHRSKVLLQGSITEIKAGYSQNLFETETPADAHTVAGLLPAHIRLTATSKNDGLYRHTFSLSGNTASGELVAILLPHIPLKGFREILPTMHDIFVRTVSETGTGAENN